VYKFYDFLYEAMNNDGQQFYQYQQNEQPHQTSQQQKTSEKKTNNKDHNVWR